jgi:hypothetical protein
MQMREFYKLVILSHGARQPMVRHFPLIDMPSSAGVRLGQGSAFSTIVRVFEREHRLARV